MTVLFMVKLELAVVLKEYFFIEVFSFAVCVSALQMVLWEHKQTEG